MGYFFAIEAISDYHYMTLHKKILEEDEQIIVERSGFWNNCKHDTFIFTETTELRVVSSRRRRENQERVILYLLFVIFLPTFLK